MGTKSTSFEPVPTAYITVLRHVMPKGTPISYHLLLPKQGEVSFNNNYVLRDLFNLYHRRPTPTLKGGFVSNASLGLQSAISITPNDIFLLLTGARLLLVCYF